MTRNRKWLWGLAAGAAVLAGALWLRRQRSGSPAPWEYPAPPDPLPGLGVRAESRYFDVNGISMHAVTAGEPGRPLVVLLHGFPESWYSWRHQIAPLVAAGFRVAAPDQRGYGRTAKAPPYSVGTLVEDVAGLIHALGYERAHVAGHDWGAAVAWACAVRHPDLVSRLAILNVPHPAVMQAALRGGNPRQIGRSWYMFFFQIPNLPEWLLGRDDFAFLERVMVNSSLPGTFTAEDLAQYKQAWREPGALPAMLGWYRTIIRRAVSGRGRTPAIDRDRRAPGADQRVTMPTLVLWGEHDIALGVELAEESMQWVEHGELVRLPDATHWVHEDRPEEVGERLVIHFTAAARPPAR